MFHGPLVLFSTCYSTTCTVVKKKIMISVMSDTCVYRIIISFINDVSVRRVNFNWLTALLVHFTS